MDRQIEAFRLSMLGRLYLICGNLMSPRDTSTSRSASQLLAEVELKRGDVAGAPSSSSRRSPERASSAIHAAMLAAEIESPPSKLRIA